MLRLSLLVHNHPSGHAAPSGADVSITKRLENALNTVDITVLDHFIFGFGESVSLKDRGLF